jgi:hypothetical protein
MRSRFLLSLILTLACGLGLPWARPAAAQSAAVKRAVENILLAPLDFVVAPVTAYKTLDVNMETTMESTGGRVTTGIFGYPLVLGAYGVLAGFREAAGIIELPVGLALWPVNAFHKVSVSAFFDEGEAAALVDVPSSAFHLKFGTRYLAAH